MPPVIAAAAAYAVSSAVASAAIFSTWGALAIAALKTVVSLVVSPVGASAMRRKEPR